MGLHRRHEDRSKQEQQQQQQHALHPLPKHIPLPQYGNSNQKILYRLPIAVFMLMALLLFTLLIRSSSSGIQATHHDLLHPHKQQKQPELELELELELEPPPQTPESLQPKQQQQQLPVVCSHQILNPPPLKPSSSNDSQEQQTSPLDGSLDGMTALFQNGVHCFDIDVVTLSDGTLLASHPSRLKQAIQEGKGNNATTDQEIVITDYTLQSLSQSLDLQKYNNPKNTIRGSTLSTIGSTSSPFPSFDEQLLPHFAELVRGIPGAFSKHEASSAFPWALRGPLLNIDLKQGPHLTTEKVLELAQRIHDLQLEDYVAVCVMDNGAGGAQHQDHDDDVDLLQILHEHNTIRKEHQTTTKSIIPLTLVLRDLVPQDANVDNIRYLVETVYPQSIKALVPSFKFPLEWFQNIRKSKDETTKTNSMTNELWRLPMTVWTIDTKADYDAVTSLTATTADNKKNDKIPMASAVVANSPMELLTTL